MNESYHSHVIEAPNCLGFELDEGSERCKNCVWFYECEEDVYEKWKEEETSGDETLAKTLRFQCECCGFCCRHLLVDINGGKGTIFLLPRETKLFPKDIIRPFFGSGKKGRSRPRPLSIWAYQIATNVCPHIKPDNHCVIYPKRPLMCRAYPLEGIGLVLLHRECQAIQKQAEEGEIIEAIVAPEEKKANALLARYTWKHVGSPMWYFDLATEKWKILPTDKILKRLPI